jgi:hypothetical protein
MDFSTVSNKLPTISKETADLLFSAVAMVPTGLLTQETISALRKGKRFSLRWVAILAKAFWSVNGKSVPFAH